jgi:sialic acid synthase SpsE
MSGASALAKYQEDAGESDPREMLRRLELDDDAMRAVVERARRRGVLAIVTIFSIELVDSATRMGWDAYKFASPDVINRPLIEAITRLGPPVLVSTGAATLEETVRAHGWLREWKATDRCAFLQCVSSYPARIENASLGGIGALLDALDCPIGYSDHTPCVDTGALAVCAGASVLEKHLTYDRSAKGPDHSASLDPHQFAEYVRLARRAHTMLGERVKVVAACEADVRRVSRQSIVAKRPITAGERITRDSVTVKRPGTGLAPYMLNETLARSAARDIQADTPIQLEDLA